MSQLKNISISGFTGRGGKSEGAFGGAVVWIMGRGFGVGSDFESFDDLGFI
jgi:hypothetical protein